MGVLVGIAAVPLLLVAVLCSLFLFRDGAMRCWGEIDRPCADVISRTVEDVDGGDADGR